MIMKRYLTLLALLVLLPFAASARPLSDSAPRSMGFRIGVTGFDVTYQHSFNRNQFLQGDFGIDFGYNVNGNPGGRATAIYNFIWARPAWTHKGSWGLYAGPGITLGYVNDAVHYKIGEEIVSPGNEGDGGFMLAFAVQVGLEYNFDFPLAMALEIRHCFGMHANDGVRIGEHNYGGRVGFYDNGLLGFVPTFALRYRF